MREVLRARAGEAGPSALGAALGPFPTQTKPALKLGTLLVLSDGSVPFTQLHHGRERMVVNSCLFIPFRPGGPRGALAFSLRGTLAG